MTAALGNRLQEIAHELRQLDSDNARAVAELGRLRRLEAAIRRELRAPDVSDDGLVMILRGILEKASDLDLVADELRAEHGSEACPTDRGLARWLCALIKSSSPDAAMAALEASRRGV